MFTFLVVVTVIVLGLLVLVTAIRPEHETRAADLLSLQRITSAFLLVSSVLLLIVTFGWAIGIIGGLLVVLFYGAVSRVGWVERLAHKLYAPMQAPLTRFSEKHPTLFAVFRVVPLKEAQHHLSSREELERLVAESGSLLSSDEKKVISQSLVFNEIIVKSVMTPRSVISTINKDEFLGPLVLSELHTVGHSRLPVINGDIDHVVGVLHLNDLLTLTDKKSETAENVMDPTVYYIHEDDTLHHALMAFLKTRRHLFIVVNEFRETVGLLTLEDVMESLLGRKIVDEDDNHADLRAVATRNKNNQPSGHVDV